MTGQFVAGAEKGTTLKFQVYEDGTTDGKDITGSTDLRFILTDPDGNKKELDAVADDLSLGITKRVWEHNDLQPHGTWGVRAKRTDGSVIRVSQKVEFVVEER